MSNFHAALDTYPKVILVDWFTFCRGRVFHLKAFKDTSISGDCPSPATSSQMSYKGPGRRRRWCDIRGFMSKSPCPFPRKRLVTCTSDFADILRSPPEYPSCECDEHRLNLTPHINDPLIFTRIAAPVHPTSKPSTPFPPIYIAAPRAPPPITFTAGRGAAVEQDGKPEPGCYHERDELNPPSANRAKLANTVPQPSSLSSAIDSNRAIADRAREPNAERVGGDLAPRISHCWYDII